ncbi:lytic murein transglycosylase B [Aquabacterium sp. J223]|uniref:lytic murein transglycosylase B n=1 Tax=Aquabacterium sp. J223 TaxID=2898431 RepID=UPI0021ADB494|nr:lytic murein transglycosylase B [Aquabacterium sp. J223]UUX95151.1 lytic murein transglycosylase B [Aquabacterium sp. J223]
MTLPCRALALSCLLAAGLVAGAAAAPSAEVPARARPKAAKPATKPAAVRADDAPEAVTYGRREDVMRFAAETAERLQLDPDWVAQQLAQARFQPSVVRFIMPPPAGTAKNWAAYRARFVEPKRVRAGADFWALHADTLARAQAQYGVPAEIVVGVIGVETFYGRMMGGYRVLDALATLAFDFPSGRSDRSAFFRDELAQFLALCRREALDCRQPRGSYAGAMGWPQFMPSSWNAQAVDYDGNGRVDLIGSAVDAIGSVAHYLAAHGWQPGLPTHYGVAPPVDSTARATLLAPDIVPSFSPAQFTELGARLAPEADRHDGPLALVELQNGEAAPSFVAGTRNFYVVTRYNWSSYYAMAVIELGRAVAEVRGLPVAAGR